MLSQIWAIVRKDLTLEMRSKDVLVSMLVFGLVVIVTLNFAFESSRRELQQMSPGILWITFTFAGILGLNRMFAMEKENQCLEGMLLAPVDPGSIYLGKWLSSTLFMLIAEAILFFLTVILFDLSVLPILPGMIQVILLGTSSFCAVGTLFSAIAANTRMREVMLPILVFPVVTPVLVSAVECTSALLEQDAMGTFESGRVFLVGCNLIYVIVSYLVFGYVLEE